MHHRRRGAVAGLVTVLVSILAGGCTGTDTDARTPVAMKDDLVGTFEQPDGAVEIQLAADDAFTAAHLPGDQVAGQVESVGSWELLDGSLFLHVEDAQSGEQRKIVPVSIVSADELGIRDEGEEIDLVRVE